MSNPVTRQFILAGNSTFTVEEPDGPHHTYRVQATEPSTQYPQVAWFVDFLSGPDNESSYTKLGKLDDFTGVVRTYGKTAKLASSRKLLVLNRVLARVWAGDHQAIEAAGWKLHHEGKCGRCGRKLTTPESVERGIGPECAEIMGMAKLPALPKQEPRPLPAVPAPAKVATQPKPTLEEALRYASVMAAGCKAGIGLVAATESAEAGLASNRQVVTAPRRESATSVFASELGLKAGQWPTCIETDAVYRRSNEVYDADGELSLIQYVAKGGKVLTVFND